MGKMKAYSLEKYMIKIKEDSNIQKFIKDDDIESAVEYVQKELINK